MHARHAGVRHGCRWASSCHGDDNDDDDAKSRYGMQAQHRASSRLLAYALNAKPRLRRLRRPAPRASECLRLVHVNMCACTSVCATSAKLVLQGSSSISHIRHLDRHPYRRTHQDRGWQHALPRVPANACRCVLEHAPQRARRAQGTRHAGGSGMARLRLKGVRGHRQQGRVLAGKARSKGPGNAEQRR